MIQFQTLECLENYAANVASNGDIANKINDFISQFFYHESLGFNGEEDGNCEQND